MTETKKWIALAVAAQAITMGMTFWLNSAAAEINGAELSTRNTARVAAIFFAFALALRRQPSEGRAAAFGFVTAHAMHFASVAYYSVVSAKAPLHELNLKSALSVTLGGTLLAALAFTISAQQRWTKAINSVAFFLFGFVFTFSTIYNGLGLRHRSAWGSAVPLPFLLVAIFWHLRGRGAPPKALAASAS